MEFDYFHEYYVDGMEFPGDHASKWETSLMLALNKNLVDMKQLTLDVNGDELNSSVIDEYVQMSHENNWFELGREHPWYGIAAGKGNNPLDASAELGKDCIEKIIKLARIKILEALE